jgi:hypothetical protein
VSYHFSLIQRQANAVRHEDREDSTTTLLPRGQRRFLVLLSAALAGIVLVIVLVEMKFSGPPATVALPETPVKQKAPEASLKAVVTNCDMIAKSIDRTGSVSEQISDYRRLAGYVENTGEVTVKFVRVKAIYRNSDDKIIQIEEIFAVGDTPLYPGQRANFEDSKRNYLIQKCGAKVMDWWVVSPEENN